MGEKGFAKKEGPTCVHILWKVPLLQHKPTTTCISSGDFTTTGSSQIGHFERLSETIFWGIFSWCSEQYDLQLKPYTCRIVQLQSILIMPTNYYVLICPIELVLDVIIQTTWKMEDLLAFFDSTANCCTSFLTELACLEIKMFLWNDEK